MSWQSASTAGDLVSMSLLNTTFIKKANIVFINAAFSWATIGAMEKPLHPSARRLFDAALKLHGIRTPAELASELNESEQRINNWRFRGGVSKDGLLLVQRKLGINATWVEDGSQSMTPESLYSGPQDADATPGDGLVKIAAVIGQLRSAGELTESDAAFLETATAALQAGLEPAIHAALLLVLSRRISGEAPKEASDPQNTSSASVPDLNPGEKAASPPAEFARRTRAGGRSAAKSESGKQHGRGKHGT